jgi:hypothetical protein
LRCLAAEGACSAGVGPAYTAYVRLDDLQRVHGQANARELREEDANVRGRRRERAREGGGERDELGRRDGDARVAWRTSERGRVHARVAREDGARSGHEAKLDVELGQEQREPDVVEEDQNIREIWAGDTGYVEEERGKGTVDHAGHRRPAA